MLKQRIVTGLALAAVIIFLMFAAPDSIWSLVIAGVVWLASGEWAALVKAQKLARIAFGIASVLPVLLMGFGIWKPDGFLYLAIFGGGLAFWLFTVPALLYHQPSLEGVYARFGFGFVALVPCSIAFVFLRAISPWCVLAFLFPICLADIAAYFAGSQWGKTKLAPSISPGKTREGVAGALVAVALYALIFAFTIPQVGSKLGVVGTLIASIVFTLIAVGGDLFESLLKRKAGVKDSGNILPGHGGVLDRIDSVLAAMPLAGLFGLALFSHV